MTEKANFVLFAPAKSSKNSHSQADIIHWKI